MREDFGGNLPFARAEAETLETVVEEMICDLHDRRYWQNAGMNHLQRFHTPRAVVARAVELFDQVLAEVAA